MARYSARLILCKSLIITLLEHDRVAVFDLTDLNSGGLNHSTFATSPEIVSLIGSRLAAGQEVADSHQRFSDTLFTGTSGAVSAFGNAAGLVVSAPTAAIDADARDAYGERMRQLSGGLLDR